MAKSAVNRDVRSLDVDLDAPGFFSSVAATLAGELEETIGLIEASSFVGQVGDEVGSAIGALYAEQMGGLPTDPAELAAVLIDLKRRIGGDFSIESVSDTEIILVNNRCPFAGKAAGRPSLCMMTTNVFGRIVSDARGYAHLKVEEAIAAGRTRCRVRIRLKDEQEDDGYEFFS